MTASADDLAFRRVRDRLLPHLRGEERMPVPVGPLPGPTVTPGYELAYRHPSAAREGPVARPELRDLRAWPEDWRACAQVMIDHLETTPERSWLTGHVRSADGKKHCALSHAFALAGNTGWEIMETMLCGQEEIYLINDGRHADYPPEVYPTPKGRVLAALRDYQAGRREDLYASLDRWLEAR